MGEGGICGGGAGKRFPRNCVLVVLAVLAAASADTIVNRHCRVQDNTAMICNCATDEEFFLPEYDYQNITSLTISACAYANLYFSSLLEVKAEQISEIVVQNISEILLFDLKFLSSVMKRCELSQIRRIPLISHDTFTNLRTIELFLIKDTYIERFEEVFTDIVVTNFVMSNVAIGQIDGISLSERGKLLEISKTEFQNGTGSLYFGNFSTVRIRDSRFALQKPGSLTVSGDTVSVTNSVFLNASMNLSASTVMVVNGTCAEGSSTLRLFSRQIESSYNKLPTEISYPQNNTSATVVARNNTICIAGNCKCPKKNGQASLHPAFLLLLLLVPVSALS